MPGTQKGDFALCFQWDFGDFSEKRNGKPVFFILTRFFLGGGNFLPANLKNLAVGPPVAPGWWVVGGEEIP